MRFHRGIFQGDSLSPLVFCVTLLPLSFELKQLPGYKAGPPSKRDFKINHLLYVYDLKLYASGKKELQLALNKVLECTSAMGMSFGLDKCAVLHIS